MGIHSFSMKQNKNKIRTGADPRGGGVNGVAGQPEFLSPFFKGQLNFLVDK